jgi:hypothetical protein
LLLCAASSKLMCRRLMLNSSSFVGVRTAAAAATDLVAEIPGLPFAG